MEAFDRWLKKHYPIQITRSLIEKSLTNEIKEAIFDYFFIEDFNISRIAYRVFNLASQGEKYKQKYKAAIKNLIVKPNHDYKAALALATELKLQFHFPWKDIVIPAILMSVPKHFYEEFLSCDNKRSEQFVRWLDNLYEDNTFKISQLHAQYINILPKLDLSRLNNKALEKFIKSSVETFDLGPNAAPNFTSKKRFLHLRYLVLNERYGKPLNIWRDLVSTTVRDDARLQSKLIEILERDDIYEAAYWANRLEVKNVPLSVTQLLENIKKGVDSFPPDEEETVENPVNNTQNIDKNINDHTSIPWGEKDWSNSPWPSETTIKTNSVFYEFPLRYSDITFIDDRKGLHEFLEYLSKSAEYIYGLDTEFAPSNFLSKGTIATIQIANNEKVFILDMIGLSKLEDIGEDFELFIRAFFTSITIRIVGYGLSSDWTVLQNTHPAFKNIEERMTASCIDLFQLSSRITKGYNSALFELPFIKEECRGLTGLTESLFNKPLDKKYQVSDWSKRPLLPDQMIYAALDALICVKIFNELQSLAIQANQESKFQEWCDVLVKHRNKLPKDYGHVKQTESKELNVFSDGKKTQKKDASSMKPSNPLNDEPIEPPDLKVVCENMLQGLCKKLRLQGVDAVALEAYEHFEVAKELGEKESRMIITKSLSHANQLRKIFKREHVLLIAEEKVEDQINEVFWYFNVQPDEKYVFSRCSKCNNSTYISIQSSIMMKLYRQLSTSNDSHNQSDDKTIIVQQKTRKEKSNTDSEEKLQQHVKCKGGEINMFDGKIKNGAVLQIAILRESTIEAHDEFFGCIKCGKIFWEGSHWDRYLGKRNISHEPR